jgi:hypothetical protein
MFMITARRPARPGGGPHAEWELYKTQWYATETAARADLATHRGRARDLRLDAGPVSPVTAHCGRRRLTGTVRFLADVTGLAGAYLWSEPSGAPRGEA